MGVFLYDLIGADLFCHIKIRGSAGTLSKILNGKSLGLLGDFSCNKLHPLLQPAKREGIAQ